MCLCVHLLTYGSVSKIVFYADQQMFDQFIFDRPESLALPWGAKYVECKYKFVGALNLIVSERVISDIYWDIELQVGTKETTPIDCIIIASTGNHNLFSEIMPKLIKCSSSLNLKRKIDEFLEECQSAAHNLYIALDFQELEFFLEQIRNN